jgi:rhomboid protease GluP
VQTDDDFHEEEAAQRLGEVGRYSRVSKAHDHGLVVLAMGIPYWLRPLPEGGYGMFVEREHLDSVREQLARYERENRYWPPRQDLVAGAKASVASIGVYLLLIWGIFILTYDELWQQGGAWEEAILQGEWWRAITALTLHGDWAHLVGNSAGGFLFFALVFRFLGVGYGWTAILLSGFIGNLLNAWSYAGSGHRSIGASTAVFGALGIVVGYRLVRQFRLTRWRWPHHLWVPLAGGLVLLGFLGAGGERTDVLAHWWGFFVGGVLGAIAAALRLDQPGKHPVAQRYLPWVVLLVVSGAWALALRG